MYLDYSSLFVVLLAMVVAGILLGRVWSYFSAREEHMHASRMVRGSSAYVMGMNYLIANQPDLAIMELSRAARQDPEAVEVHIVLGNLYREKGQVERAIQIHRAVIGREAASPSERNLALLCLGLDYKSAGLVDKAIEAFEQLMELDPHDERAYSLLVKLYEEVGQLDRAYRLQQDLIRLQRSDDRSVLAFLETKMGKKRMDAGELDAAERRFRRAIDLEPQTYPAYLFYGDLLMQRGRKDEAVEMWERMVHTNHKTAHLAYGRLKAAYTEMELANGGLEALSRIAREVIDRQPYDWRSRIFLADLHADSGRPLQAYELLTEALRFNPHSLTVHQKIWRLFGGFRNGEKSEKLGAEYIDDYLQLSDEIIFFLDPFVCIECGYKTTEYLWKCPHCHAWDSFVEVRN